MIVVNMSDKEVNTMAAAWRANLDAVYDAILAKNATTWDLSFSNSYNVPNANAMTVPRPTVITHETCAAVRKVALALRVSDEAWGERVNMYTNLHVNQCTCLHDRSHNGKCTAQSATYGVPIGTEGCAHGSRTGGAEVRGNSCGSS